MPSFDSKLSKLATQNVLSQNRNFPVLFLLQTVTYHPQSSSNSFRTSLHCLRSCSISFICCHLWRTRVLNLYWPSEIIILAVHRKFAKCCQAIFIINYMTHKLWEFDLFSDDFQLRRLNIKGVDPAIAILITLISNLLKWKTSQPFCAFFIWTIFQINSNISKNHLCLQGVCKLQLST